VRVTGNAARMANPSFNANKLKMGVFFANIGGGARPTLADDRTRLSWPSLVEIAQMADRAGIEDFIPLATWSARNRDSDFTKYSYEPWTWAAAIAQATRNICVFTTAQVPIFPPVVAAKLTATVDHISNGRFAMNAVCGHARKAPEGLVGAPELGHDEWYAYADEWVEILDRLWSEPDIFDYSGRYFDLKGAGSYPKPLQQPRPPIMNAGIGRGPALGSAPLGHDVHCRANWRRRGHQGQGRSHPGYRYRVRPRGRGVDEQLCRGASDGT